MRINTRFPVAVHILVLVSFGTTPPTSDLLARSVNTNPVVIRRTVALLKKAGLVQVRAGVGGAVLLRPPEAITLLDIYKAVQADEDGALFDLHQNPNPKCYVGANIHAALGPALADAQNALEQQLATWTLADIAAPIKEKKTAISV